MLTVLVGWLCPCASSSARRRVGAGIVTDERGRRRRGEALGRAGDKKGGLTFAEEALYGDLVLADLDEGPWREGAGGDRRGWWGGSLRRRCGCGCAERRAGDGGVGLGRRCRERARVGHGPASRGPSSVELTTSEATRSRRSKAGRRVRLGAGRAAGRRWRDGAADRCVALAECAQQVREAGSPPLVVVVVVASSAAAPLGSASILDSCSAARAACPSRSLGTLCWPGWLPRQSLLRPHLLALLAATRGGCAACPAQRRSFRRALQQQGITQLCRSASTGRGPALPLPEPSRRASSSSSALSCPPSVLAQGYTLGRRRRRACSELRDAFDRAQIVACGPAGSSNGTRRRAALPRALLCLCCGRPGARSASSLLACLSSSVCSSRRRRRRQAAPVARPSAVGPSESARTWWRNKLAGVAPERQSRYSSDTVSGRVCP